MSRRYGRRRRSPQRTLVSFALQALVLLIGFLLMVNVVLPWARDELVQNAQDSFFPSASPAARSGAPEASLQTP